MSNPHVPIAQNVPARFIKELLSKYEAHSLNANFNTDDLLKIMSQGDSIFEKWDVAIATTTKDESRRHFFLGEKIIPIKRSFCIRQDRKAIQLTSRIRLGTTDFAKTGLPDFIAKKIEGNWKETFPGKNFTENMYFSFGIERNPLLLIYPISLEPKVGDEKSERIADEFPHIVAGLAIGIPKIDGKPDIVYRYRMNKRKFEEMAEIDNFDDLDEIDDTVDLDS